ncbi:UPF0147 family protein [Candidatus Woesearchaeota archaeon]|nr:UPF0147 family protein [Candidatus Woesearchaeota archaeon]
MILVDLDKAVGNLSLIVEEGEVSKKCSDKIQKIITLLRSSDELCVEKALLELEEVANYDLSSYNRTQLWEIISVLETKG